MANATLSAVKTFITFKEKRRFNWIVLALLLITIGVGVASQLMEIP